MSQPDDRYYITTAIPYVNARPHIGFALELVITDAMARYQRQRGRDVWFLTGTDENSLKNVQAAEKAGEDTKAFVDRLSVRYLSLKGDLNASFDDFIRTSAETRHVDGVRKLWQACESGGDVYRRRYSGLYCVGCEQFYAESELVGGLCPEHGTRPDEVDEENYFFRLSKYAGPLIERIESGLLRIEPATRRNEVLSFIRMGLEDFSISRSQERAKGWGVPVPGDPSQVMYVWFDALGNYVTALDYAHEGEAYRQWWTENPHRVHVLGKGVTRFHAVYWPAMLLSAGVPLPTTIFVHGYITVDGAKMSKSVGNTVDPVELARSYGIDPVRYYLLRHIRSTEDGDFTLERFIRANNADLADQLGNLLSRTAGMVGRYRAGVVPAGAAAEDAAISPSKVAGASQPGSAAGAFIAVDPADAALRELAKEVPQRVAAAMERFLNHDALAAIWDLVDAANKYVVENRPWVLAKSAAGGDEVSEARLNVVLYNLVEVLRLAALHAWPFLPASCEAIFAQLGLAGSPGALDPMGEAGRWGGYPAGTAFGAGNPLFPKFELPDDTVPDDTVPDDTVT